MTGSSDNSQVAFMALARQNLKSASTNLEARETKTVGGTGKAPNPIKSPKGRLLRFVKGTGFLVAVFVLSSISGFVVGLYGLLIVALAATACFSCKWKAHGLSIPVGLAVLLFAGTAVLAGWKRESDRQSLPLLRQSDPAGYVKEARRFLSRKDWLAEAKLLAPQVYQDELAKDAAIAAAAQHKAKVKQIREEAELQANAETNRKDACHSDWSKCKDNTELYERYADLQARAPIQCKRAANEQAKYGTPEWPWSLFGSYRSGNSGPVKGEVELIEKDAKFQNGFGAMKHVTVSCFYDLKSGTVQFVQIY